MGKEKLVLMSCCAPCSAEAIRRLWAERRDFIVLFYNPNIFPHEEYRRRLDEQIAFCEKIGVPHAVGKWDHDEWLNCIKGLEAEAERGRRCLECFRQRALFGIKWAKENGYDKITSVFGVSRHKDQSQVDKAFEGSDITYVPFDFKYMPEPGMYRQKHCGCEFSETYHGGK